ncbi:MAG: hypothetical protein M1570_05180 [Chloroflexi bacterium]|nr:hypothetical protein [Chloroflexota bacterium]
MLEYDIIQALREIQLRLFDEEGPEDRMFVYCFSIGKSRAKPIPVITSKQNRRRRCHHRGYKERYASDHYYPFIIDWYHSPTEAISNDISYHGVEVRFPDYILIDRAVNEFIDRVKSVA